MLGDDACLDALEDGQGEGDAPEYSASSFHRRYVPVGVDQDVLHHPDSQANQEETIRDDVVVVPEREISFLEPSNAGIWLLKPPEKESGPDISQEIRSDEYCQGSIYPINCRRRRF